MIGRFFGGLSTGVALILMLAPLLCWGTELPQLRCRPAWVVGSLRLLLVVIPLAALMLQAKRRFDRDTAPLLMQRSESQDYIGAHRRGSQESV
jgi:4-amino-4-deoxy-L-arabinose transferase-like glycosyltransferase